jgi:3-hydroxymyristoyl/3-hydroxydecanoyl-(acyl carrier protein) dehydratase|tara:strand:+ start:1351 stop:3744 length:2394 start_codon:yes stop_codon:yes gene_type:complete
MAEIDKTLNEAPQGVEEEIVEEAVTEDTPMEVEVEGDEPVSLGPVPADTGDGFANNLAESIAEETLAQISNELRSQFSVDQTSRKDWEQSYIKGLDLLGFKYTEVSEPFRGAASVSHPLLAEAVTQFQAGAYKELLPAGGPVKTSILGLSTPEVEQQAERVKEFMNYQITYKMKEYDPEMDQLLFHLPLAGSAFKKVYYDSNMGRPCAKFIPSEDLVVNYGASELDDAERITHVIKISPNDLKRQMLSGFYRDIDMEDNDELYSSYSDIQEKYDELEGVKKSGYAGQYELLEMHVDLNLEGYEDVGQDGEPTGLKLPYVVTLEQGNGKILSIYRNYLPNDPMFMRQKYFVHYKFLPGLGFYGFGLVHMLGGLTRTATAALRALLDAGTLSNLPAGFKSRGLRVRDDEEPLMPGEFRDVDAPGGDLRNALMPLPYKGPDGTLFQLLGYVVDAGRRFAAIADMKVGDGSQANPVGTTMALLEQGSKVMSGIHKRCHNAQKEEFDLLARLFATTLPSEYPYDVQGGDRGIKATDFDERVDVIPVSDPNIFSMSQRIMLAQTQLQLAQSNPELHNLYEAYRRMYMALGVQNVENILPPPPQPMPIDPGVENSQALMMGQLTVFPDQDHLAHIEAHRAFMSSYLVRNNPQVATILQAHVVEHTSAIARNEVMMKNQAEIQEQNAKFGGQIPPELQAQFQSEIERQVAIKIAAMTDDMVAEEQQAIPFGQTQDPLVDIKMQELQLEQQKINVDAADDLARHNLEEEKLSYKKNIDSAKLAQQQNIQNQRTAVQRERINASKKR